jgi:DNA-directed RNA polymerase alpha subunit
MKTHEEFLKAIAVVKEYQLQVEKEYRDKKKYFLNLDLTVYNSNTKLWDIDISVRLLNILKVKGFTNDSTIYEISLIPENELFKIRGFGKQLQKEFKKIKNLSGIIC